MAHKRAFSNNRKVQKRGMGLKALRLTQATMVHFLQHYFFGVLCGNLSMPEIWYALSKLIPVFVNGVVQKKSAPFYEALKLNTK